MKITYNWLQSFINLDKSAEEAIRILSKIGLEVESLEDKGKVLSQFLIADIVQVSKHPQSNNLNICTVNNGSKLLQVVCGASNVKARMKTVLAPIGAILPSSGVTIGSLNIMGIKTDGMLCSEKELSIGNYSDCIIDIKDKSLKAGDSFANSFALNDQIIDINITPNRGDCASVYGIARDLSATENGSLKLKYHNFHKHLFHFKNDKLSLPIDKSGCWEIALCKIKDVNNKLLINQEIRSIFSLLNLRSHNTLVDISNFAMFEFGRPNHIYDADKIDGKIEVRLSKKGELFQDLDRVQHHLPQDILVIADNKKVLSIAGVIGGEHSKVDTNTKNILIEVANFDPKQISHSIRQLNINTESSFRFERRVDQKSTVSFMYFITSLILKNCGGTITDSSLIQDVEPHYIKQLYIDYKRIKQLLGFNVTQKYIDRILFKLGFTKHMNSLFNIPTWRQGDIQDNNDITEEVIRIKGLDAINIKQSNFLYNAKDLKQEINNHSNIFRKILVNRNLYEIISWSFINQEHANLFQVSNNSIVITNSISKEMAVMRASIIPGLLKIVKNNIAKGFKDLSFFEIGKVYSYHDDKISEENCLTILRTGNAISRNPFSDQRKFDFYDVKDDCLSLLSEINISLNDLRLVRIKSNIYHPGKNIAFYIDQNLIGYIGVLHPQIIKKFNINQDIICAEIFYDKLPKQNLEKRKTLFLPRLQTVSRDFAFYFSYNIETEKITKVINSLQINILKEVNIFDIHTNSQHQLKYKSIAFSIKLQPIKKPLVFSEIEVISTNIIEAIKQKLGGKLRDKMSF